MGTSLWGKTIEVCASCEVKSIKEGVALATDFDTLLIKNGNYKEFKRKEVTIYFDKLPNECWKYRSEIISEWGLCN